MHKWIMVFVALLLFPAALHATEVASGRFSFNLNGDWSVTEEDYDAVTAVLQSNEINRAFILSVHKLASSEEIVNTLLYLRNYLGSLSEENGALVKEADFKQYKTESGAPFDYIVYTDEAQSGFFIGATLGSNSGVVLVTYEGSGSYQDGIDELKAILDNMKII